MTYEYFADKHNIHAAARPITARTDGAHWAGKGNHYSIVLSIGGGKCTATKARTIWTGEFSKGIGHAEAWARENKHKARLSMGHDYAELVALPRGRRVSDSSPFWDKLTSAAAKHIQPKASEILESLAMDASGSDQLFEDWAADFGYSSDSREGHRAWEACNNIRRKLEAALGHTLFNELMGL